MPKPEWMTQLEKERRFRHCASCQHVGELCGRTNYIDKEHGRAPMFKCSLHPTIQVYYKTYACEDFKYGPTGKMYS